MGNRTQASLGLAIDRRRLLRGGCRDERGGILLMFALFIVLFCLLCAVVVDVGYWWVMGKKTQVAADACALAAAGELPQSWDAPPLNHCLIVGRDYAKTNLPHEGLANEPRHISTVVTTPYPQPGGGDPATYVEAEVTVRVRTFFGRVVGLDNLTLSRRAVAEKSEGEPGNYAIYSHSTNCSEGLEFNGATHAINGRVHSNGEYRVNNSPPQPFWAQTGTALGCTSLSPPGEVRFGGTSYATATETTPTILPAPEPWPEYFIPSDFSWPNCSGANFSGEEIEISNTELKIDGQNKPFPIVNGRHTIPEGTYCATKHFRINGDNIDGKITALAPELVANGSNLRLTPFATNGVLFFLVPNIDTSSTNDGAPNGTGPLSCQSKPELTLVNGGSGQWKGKVFNPCSEVRINGDSAAAFEGAIYGERVKVNGNGFTMTGTGGGGDNTKAVALVE